MDWKREKISGQEVSVGADQLALGTGRRQRGSPWSDVRALPAAAPVWDEAPGKQAARVGVATLPVLRQACSVGQLLLSHAHEALTCFGCGLVGSGYLGNPQIRSI